MKNEFGNKENNLDIFLEEETSDQKLLKIELSEVEQENLWRVFRLLCSNRNFREGEMKWFDASDVKAIFKKLGIKYIQQQKLDLMIWEVDENLDKRVDEKEFELMYKKCREDKNFIEPKNLFNLVQYLMFCKPKEVEEGMSVDPFNINTEIVPEDTYFIIFARIDKQNEDVNKREKLDDEIAIIFGLFK
mgnify:CR=1 FL=1